MEKAYKIKWNFNPIPTNFYGLFGYMEISMLHENKDNIYFKKPIQFNKSTDRGKFLKEVANNKIPSYKLNEYELIS